MVELTFHLDFGYTMDILCVQQTNPRVTVWQWLLFLEKECWCGSQKVTLDKVSVMDRRGIKMSRDLVTLKGEADLDLLCIVEGTFRKAQRPFYWEDTPPSERESIFKCLRKKTIGNV